MKPEPHKQISEIHLHIAENRASVEKYYPDRIIRFKSYNLQLFAFQNFSTFGFLAGNRHIYYFVVNTSSRRNILKKDRMALAILSQ